MKNLIAILIVLASFTAKAYETVENSDVVYGANIEKLYADHDFLNNVDFGDVNINMTAKTIKVTFFHKMECPTDMFCALVMPAPTIITLPLVRQFIDRCGSEIFSAEVDNTPVDGIKEVISVTDNTNNTCPTFVTLPETSVQYSTYNPWVNETTYSVFNGSILRLLPTYF